MGKPKLSDQEVKKIISLRHKGMSILEIKEETSRGVATIQRIVKNVKVTGNSLKILKLKQGGSKMRAQLGWQRSLDSAKLLFSENLSSREKVLIASCLYWGEGNKTEFNLSNTDPGLIKVFLLCLEEIGVSRDRLKVSIRTYEDLDRSICIKYWAHLLEIPESKILSVNVIKGKKKGKLKYGMCRIRISKGEQYFKILSSVVEILRQIFNAPVVQRIERLTPNELM